MMVDPVKKPANPSQNQVSLTRNERIAIIVFLALAIIYTGWRHFAKSNVEVELGDDIPGGIIVNVEGAVRSPGNIFLPAGSSVLDAVEAAGGFEDWADEGGLNLGESLVDGQRIFVPTASGSVDPPPPNWRDRNSMQEYQPRIVDNPYHTDSSSPRPQSININTANKYQLQELPGIGEVLADAIIDYRNANGRFEKIEDIKNVDGIGETRFNEMRPYITVED